MSVKKEQQELSKSTSLKPPRMVRWQRPRNGTQSLTKLPDRSQLTNLYGVSKCVGSFWYLLVPTLRATTPPGAVRSLPSRISNAGKGFFKHLQQSHSRHLHRLLRPTTDLRWGHNHTPSVLLVLPLCLVIRHRCTRSYDVRPRAQMA